MIYLYYSRNKTGFYKKKLLECVHSLKEKLLESSFELVNRIEDSRIVICIGGDGSVLSAQKHIKDQLLITVNPLPKTEHPEGSFGFYSGFTYKEIDKIIDLLDKEDFLVSRLDRLCAMAPSKKIISLNEIQVYPIPNYRLLKFNIQILLKDEKEISIDGASSGILIYTETGFYGFASNLDAGLPINGIGITCIAPCSGFFKECKSISIPSKDFDEIILSLSRSLVVADSRSDEIIQEKEVKIKKYHPLNFVENPDNIKFFKF